MALESKFGEHARAGEIGKQQTFNAVSVSFALLPFSLALRCRGGEVAAPVVICEFILTQPECP